MCLLFSKTSISADHNVPAFSEVGTPFYPPILKKRQMSVIVERFLKTAKKIPDKARKSVRLLYERKNFDCPLLFPAQMSVVKWGATNRQSLCPQIISSEPPLIHRENVRCKVKRNFCSPPITENLSAVKWEAFPNIFLKIPVIFDFSVRWIVKSEDVGTKPASDSLSEVRGFSKFPFRHYQVSSKKRPL